MTKEVFIRIEGSQLGAEEDPIVQTAMGSYYFHNGRHFILYNEKEEEEGMIKNTMKIGLTQAELSKQGAGASKMTFDINQETEAVYQTPYGSLCFQVKTSKIAVSATQKTIRMKLEYSLYSMDSHLSNHETLVTIESAERSCCKIQDE